MTAGKRERKDTTRIFAFCNSGFPFIIIIIIILLSFRARHLPAMATASNIDYGQVTRILAGPEWEDMPERRKAAIERLGRLQGDEGLAWSELSGACDVLEASIARVKDGSYGMVEATQSFLHAFKKPFKMERASDRLKYWDGATRAADLMGNIITSDHAPYQLKEEAISVLEEHVSEVQHGLWAVQEAFTKGLRVNRLRLLRLCMSFARYGSDETVSEVASIVGIANQGNVQEMQQLNDWEKEECEQNAAELAWIVLERLGNDAPEHQLTEAIQALMSRSREAEEEGIALAYEACAICGGGMAESIAFRGLLRSICRQALESGGNRRDLALAATVEAAVRSPQAALPQALDEGIAEAVVNAANRGGVQGYCLAAKLAAVAGREVTARGAAEVAGKALSGSVMGGKEAVCALSLAAQVAREEAGRGARELAQSGAVQAAMVMLEGEWGVDAQVMACKAVEEMVCNGGEAALDAFRGCFGGRLLADQVAGCVGEGSHAKGVLEACCGLGVSVLARDGYTVEDFVLSGGVEACLNAADKATTRREGSAPIALVGQALSSCESAHQHFYQWRGQGDHSRRPTGPEVALWAGGWRRAYGVMAALGFDAVAEAMQDGGTVAALVRAKASLAEEEELVRAGDALAEEDRVEPIEEDRRRLEAARHRLEELKSQVEGEDMLEARPSSSLSAVPGGTSVARSASSRGRSVAAYEAVGQGSLGREGIGKAYLVSSRLPPREPLLPPKPERFEM